MWELINAPENWVFSMALAVMLLLGVLEVAGIFLGGLSGWLETLVPGSLMPDSADLPDQPAGADFMAHFLSWLYVGRVPILMLLICFLALFGSIGLGMQALLKQYLGFFLPVMAALPLAFLLCLPALRLCAAGLHAILPRDESTAVSEASLVGRVGEIILGEARPGYPAQTRVKGEHGQTHYVMVEPDTEEVLPNGAKVLLVAVHGAGYKAIVNVNPNLN